MYLACELFQDSVQVFVGDFTVEYHQANVFLARVQEGLNYFRGVLESDGKYAGYYGIFPAESASRVPP